MIKNFMIKLVFEGYVRFGVLLKKIIPISVRGKIKYAINQHLKKNLKMKKNKAEKFVSGVNLVGYITAEMGLGHGCRLIARALENSEISWNAINYEKLNSVRYGDETWKHKIVNEPIYNINIVHINPDNLYLANMYLPKNIWNVPYNIGFYLWELTDIPDEWVEGFEFFDEIWAPSQFVVDAVKKKTNKPVLKVPYGIEVAGHNGFTRDSFSLPSNVFLFLTMYDVNSTAERKNPLGSIHAFKKAFEATDGNVGIVVKINNAGQAMDEISKLQDSLKEYKHVYFIEETLSRSAVNGLINSVDCFISLHRAEGFGLVLAEAMYLGKAVIGTNWSANVDFMRSDNSCLVDYTFVTIEKDHGPYKAGQFWADPDITQAAGFMRKLVQDPMYYAEISQKGNEFIKSNYTFDVSGTIIKNRLAELDLL